MVSHAKLEGILFWKPQAKLQDRMLEGLTQAKTMGPLIKTSGLVYLV